MSDRPLPPDAHGPADDPQWGGQPRRDLQPGGEAAPDSRGRLEDRALEQRQVTGALERHLPQDLLTDTTEHYRQSTRDGTFTDLPQGDHRTRLQAHIGQMAGHLDCGDVDRASWAIDAYTHTRTLKLRGFAEAAGEGRLEPGNLAPEELERLGAAVPASSATGADAMTQAWEAEDPRAMIDWATEQVEQGYTDPYASRASCARTFVGGALACGRNYDMPGAGAAVDGLRTLLGQPLWSLVKEIGDSRGKGEPRF